MLESETGDKWYEHEAEIKIIKPLWDFSIQNDHVIEAWRQDLVVADKKR